MSNRFEKNISYTHLPSDLGKDSKKKKIKQTWAEMLS